MFSIAQGSSPKLVYYLIPVPIYLKCSSSCVRYTSCFHFSLCTQGIHDHRDRIEAAVIFRTASTYVTTHIPGLRSEIGLSGTTTSLDPGFSNEGRTPRVGHATLDESFVRHDTYYFKDGNVTFLVRGLPTFAYSMC